MQPDIAYLFHFCLLCLVCLLGKQSPLWQLDKAVTNKYTWQPGFELRRDNSPLIYQKGRSDVLLAQHFVYIMRLRIFYQGITDISGVTNGSLIIPQLCCRSQKDASNLNVTQFRFTINNKMLQMSQRRKRSKELLFNVLS